MTGNAWRYAALLGIAVANTFKARRLKFEADLRRQREQIAAMPISTTSTDQEPAERPFCGTTCTRISGEVVTCYLPWDHNGFHAGRAEGLAEAFTWPDRDSDTEQQVVQDDEMCSCQSSVLEADIVQSSANTWKWRIYDSGCDGGSRLFALGSSEDLDESREDVVDTMRLLAENGGYECGQPDYLVTHHVAVPLTYVGDA
jgi:hypothetical protein